MASLGGKLAASGPRASRTALFNDELTEVWWLDG